MVHALQSWRRLNPGWEIRFYDDEACVEFVSREFPEYLAAYRALPKHVERSDFFRYMVCKQLGDVYLQVVLREASGRLCRDHVDRPCTVNAGFAQCGMYFIRSWRRALFQ